MFLFECLWVKQRWDPIKSFIIEPLKQQELGGESGPKSQTLTASCSLDSIETTRDHFT